MCEAVSIGMWSVRLSLVRYDGSRDYACGPGLVNDCGHLLTHPPWPCFLRPRLCDWTQVKRCVEQTQDAMAAACDSADEAAVQLDEMWHDTLQVWLGAAGWAACWAGGRNCTGPPLVN